VNIEKLHIALSKEKLLVNLYIIHESKFFMITILTPPLVVMNLFLIKLRIFKIMFGKPQIKNILKLD